MNYQRIHDFIIERAKNRPKPNCYCEKHHIIPKCMGGTNDKENLAILTIKEHYLIHYLLTKIYKNDIKIACAFWIMCNGSGRTPRPIPSGRIYAYAKELYFNMKTKTLQTQN